MISLPGNWRSTEQSRLDCAVSIEIWLIFDFSNCSQELIRARAVVDQRRVAEADVHGRLALDAVDGAVERLDAVLLGLLVAGLHVGLVELHDVRAGGEQIA